MKALSVRQPWAELIMQGRKTLELRTWTVSYRGPLAIHASQTVEREACLALGLQPATLTAGAVIGVVDLVDVETLNAAALAARSDEHLAGNRFDSPTYGWRLANPRPLAHPQPAPGRMGLFNVPDTLVKLGTNGHIAPSPEPPPALETAWNPECPFELRVVAEPAHSGAADYRLVLQQRLMEATSAQRSLYRQTPPHMQSVVEVSGATLRAVADHVLEALRRSGYRATDLRPGRRDPFQLNEETGVRLGLLFLAVKPLSKLDRVEAISGGLRNMASEEVYYWYSKCTVGPGAERAQKALRVLLAAE